MQFVQSLGSNFVAVWATTLCIAAVMLIVERLLPRNRVSLRSQLRSLQFWFLAGAGTSVAITAYAYLKRFLDPDPLFVVPLNQWLSNPWLHWSIYIIAPLLGIILFDFFGYWLHRAQHRWFWRLHSVHHAIEELSGINSYFHWTEQFFRIAFISLPAAYLIRIDAVAMVFGVELLVTLQGYYLHSPNRLHLGPVIRRIVADNRFHRIHHSVEPRHFDKNFGAGTSIWDQLFGTAYFPAPDEWPRTGIADRCECQHLLEYVRASSEPRPSPLDPAPAIVERQSRHFA